MTPRMPRWIALGAAVLLGSCDFEEVVAPQTPYPQRFATVAAGEEHTCATTPAGRTFCWGNPAQSRLGHAGQVAECDGRGCTQPVPIRRNLAFSSLDAGAGHTCGVIERKAYCWGFDRFGQLGDAGSVFTRCWDELPFFCSVDPTPVAVGSAITLVTVHRMHSCALTAEGRALCWGWNIAGQLGRGFKDLEPHPDPRFVVTDLLFSDLSTGFGHTCGITREGAAYCWGYNEVGMLGVGHFEERFTPVAVGGGRSYERIAAGGQFTCGLTPSGEVYCWGWGSEGRLGTGNLTTEVKPARVLVPEPAAEISAGQHHTCAIGVSGGLYCWGTNYSGQLGVLEGDFHAVPQLVPLPEAVVEVSAGFAHTCAITEDERLYCWGDNAHGQLGFGDDPYRAVPVQVNP